MAVWLPKSDWEVCRSETGKEYCFHPVERKPKWGNPAEGWTYQLGGGMENKITGEKVAPPTVTECLWYNTWHPCTILEMRPDGISDVLWTDGTITRNVDPSNLRNVGSASLVTEGALWEAHICWDRLKEFYVNRATKESTWTPPLCFIVFCRWKRSWVAIDDIRFLNLTTCEISHTTPIGWYTAVSIPAEGCFFGEWHPCTIWRKRLDEKVDVIWSDGTGTRGLTPSQIRAPLTNDNIDRGTDSPNPDRKSLNADSAQAL
eukprot:TRINITY_DN31056_c0_g1_i1.p1 TRINITY_DN31056_c0_g1~~TRINITY_DN31056_c0_g1_i1.p1  ORF type:complete len:260 (+),score=40.86 TRINITY_DN31056_c0_g1_i1:129-908(+)